VSRAPCRIRHIEIDRGFPDLTPENGAASMLLVFWWRGIPLGSHVLSSGELPMPSSAVANIAAGIVATAVGAQVVGNGFRAPWPVRRRRLRLEPPPDLDLLVRLSAPLARVSAISSERARERPKFRVSLIICTLRRPAALLRCLESLTACPDDLDEVIVVDNEPGASDLRQQLEQFPGILYIPEPRPGLSHARNAGIRAATGDIVLFTDDDVVVHPEWPSRIAGCFADPAVMATTGLVLPAELETDAQIAFEWDLGGFGQGFRPIRYDAEFFAAGRDRGVPVWRIGCGANMAFRRAAFAKVGLFDTRLGAGASGCSEDSELWYRLLAAGGVCHYDPSAVVYHYHRSDWSSLRRQAHDYMRGHVVALFVQFWRYRHWGNLWRVFLALPYYYGNLVYRGIRYRPDARQRLLTAHVGGVIAGLVASFRLWWKGAAGDTDGGSPEIDARRVHAAR